MKSTVEKFLPKQPNTMPFDIAAYKSSPYTFDIEVNKEEDFASITAFNGKNRILKRSFPVFQTNKELIFAQNGWDISSNDMDTFVRNIRDNRTCELSIMGCNGGEEISYSKENSEIIFTMDNLASSTEVFIPISYEQDRYAWADAFENFFNQINKKFRNRDDDY